MTDANTICHDVDLLGDWLDARGYTEEAGLCLRVMGLIRKQQDEIDKLREALHPFVVAFEFRKDENDPDYWDAVYTEKFPVEAYNLRKARTALISDKLETVNALHGKTLEKLDDNT